MLPTLTNTPCHPPSLTQRIPKTNLAVFIFSDSASRPSSVFPPYFKSHSFHSYQSINMHRSFAVVIILAAPFVAAQSLSSIPSCAVSKYYSYPQQSPNADTSSPAPCSRSRYPKDWLRPQQHHLHLWCNILSRDCEAADLHCMQRS